MEQRNADLHLETNFLAPEDNYQLKGWSDSNAQLQARMSQLEDLIYEVQGGTEGETAYPRDSYRHSTSSIYQQRRSKKSGGFLDWMGKFFGCGEKRI